MIPQRGVSCSLSVCPAATLCKNSQTDRNPVWCENIWKMEYIVSGIFITTPREKGGGANFARYKVFRNIVCTQCGCRQITTVACFQMSASPRNKKYSFSNVACSWCLRCGLTAGMSQELGCCCCCCCWPPGNVSQLVSRMRWRIGHIFATDCENNLSCIHSLGWCKNPLSHR